MEICYEFHPDLRRIQNHLLFVIGMAGLFVSSSSLWRLAYVTTLVEGSFHLGMLQRLR